MHKAAVWVGFECRSMPLSLFAEFGIWSRSLSLRQAPQLYLLALHTTRFTGAIKAGNIVHVARTNVDANAIVLFEFWKFQGSSSNMRQFPVSSSNVLIIQTLRFCNGACLSFMGKSHNSQICIYQKNSYRIVMDFWIPSCFYPRNEIFEAPGNFSSQGCNWSGLDADTQHNQAQR